eukprot:5483208-Amphidinium_carterae.4
MHKYANTRDTVTAGRQSGGAIESQHVHTQAGGCTARHTRCDEHRRIQVDRTTQMHGPNRHGKYTAQASSNARVR